MKRYLDISDEIYALGEQAERVVAPYFSRIDRICDKILYGNGYYQSSQRTIKLSVFCFHLCFPFYH